MIADWKEGLLRSGLVLEEVDKLESRLQNIIDKLMQQGLNKEEAFLIGLSRLGKAQDPGAEFSRMYASQVWENHLQAPQISKGFVEEEAKSRDSFFHKFGFLTIMFTAQFIISQLPHLFGIPFVPDNESFFLINCNFIVFPMLVIYLIWRRRSSYLLLVPYAVVFLIIGWLVNIYLAKADVETSQTLLLSGIHLPLFFWITLLPLYTGSPGLKIPEHQLDFIRFTGEAFIYGFLVLCGVIVTTLATIFLFETIGIKGEDFVFRFLATGIIPLLPLAGIVLVEAKGLVLGHVVPTLARIFLPAFLIVMSIFLILSLVSGRPVSDNRDLIIAIDLLLVLVLAMVLYTASINCADEHRSGWDLLIMFSALTAALIDILALVAMASRFGLYGITPNRLAAIGENIILLGNLGGLTIAYALFLIGKIKRSTINQIQRAFILLFAGWFFTISFIFPPAFGYQ
jgi:hypothetical protein